MNRAVRDRAVLPMVIPLGAALTIVGLVFLFSRVLLSVPPFVAVAIALFAAMNILIVCAVLAVRRISSPSDLMPLFAVALVPMLLGLAISTGFIQAEEAEHGETGPAPVVIAAAGLAFDLSEIKLTAGSRAVIRFTNNDTVPHNVALYRTSDATDVIFEGEIFPGPATREYRFEAPEPGEYFFRCDVHPNMNGAVLVEEGKEGKNARGAEAVSELSASSLTFDRRELSAPAETQVTLEFTNNDTVPHNVAVYTSTDASQAIFRGEIFAGPATRRYTFTSPAKGTYFFRCDVHPTMNGSLEVG